jgi:hypothetical protein
MRSEWSVRIALTALALTVAGGVTAPAHAQYVAEFTPFFTSFYPLQEIKFDETGSTTDVRLKQKTAPALGGRLTFWLSNTIGIEGAGAFIWSSPAFSAEDESAGAEVSLPGTIFTGTGRIVVRPARTNLYLLAGGGVVSRAGEAWEGPDTKKTAIAGVAGFGARANVTPKFALNVTVEGTFYSLDPDGSDDDGGTFFQPSFQTDITVSIGIPIGFGRR